MGKHYGGTGGDAQIPTTFEAPGAWTAPTEVYRQKKVIEQWPEAVKPAESLDVGEIVFVASSGTRDELLSTNKYIEANGQEISRAAYPELFSILSVTYGFGDGVTTFRLPDYNNKNNYFKSILASGEDWTALSGTGVIPDHTHQWSGGQGTGRSVREGTSGNNCRSVTGVQYQTSQDGDPTGNHLRRNQVFVLLAASGMGGVGEPGIVSPFLLPIGVDDFNAAIQENLIVCSGSLQTVDAHPSLFRQYGTLFGGDGTATVGTPDYRGQFLQNVNLTNASVNVSGSSIGPSGYLLDTFARHSHVVNGQAQATSLEQGGGPASFIGGLGPPATSASSVGNSNTESRPANVNCIFMIVGG